MTLGVIGVLVVVGNSLPNAKSYAATSHFPSNFISGLNIYLKRDYNAQKTHCLA